MVIEWNKNGWADPSFDTDEKEADQDTIRTPFPNPMGNFVLLGSVHEYQSAL